MAASARTCLDEVRRLARLVDAMLEMARVDGARPGPGEPVDLLDLAERVVETFEARAVERDVRLACVAEGGGAVVDGDAVALESALANVVENALTYAPADSDVVVRLRGEGSAHVALVVEDAGPGVEPEEADLIFQPFVRGAAAHAGQNGASVAGAGLGLAISRRILEHHGATVSVGRSPLGGASFTLAFPRGKARPSRQRDDHLR